MTTQQKAVFSARGVLALPGFLPAERVARALCAAQAGKKRDSAVLELLGGETDALVAELLDGRPSFATGPAQILFTAPNADAWQVPHRAWHLDLPRFADGAVPGVQFFAMLDTVAPGGGGTLVVAGSHALAHEPGKRLSSAAARTRLKRAPYFRNLMAPTEGDDRGRFLHEPATVDGVEVQVVELCGAPGDLFVTDLRLLHAVAPNASERPRWMLTRRFLLEIHRDALVGAEATP